MADPQFERVFRIYIDNKDSEAFSLKFYKDTSKEDINEVVVEAIHNLKQHLKNEKLQVWQDTDCIDIDYENNLVRLKESILLSEFDPTERLITADRSNIGGITDRTERTPTPMKEDREFNYLNFVKNINLRDSPDKFDLIHFEKEEPMSGQFGNGISLDHSSNFLSPQHRLTMPSKKLQESRGQNQFSDLQKTNPTLGSHHQTPLAHSDMSITFNPVKNQSFFIDSQSLGSPYLRTGFVPTFKQSIHEDSLQSPKHGVIKKMANPQ